MAWMAPMASARSVVARSAQAVDHRPDPLRATADLGGGLLAAHVQGRGPARGKAGGELQEERALADPGIPADEDDRAGHEAATEDPVELTDARREALRLGARDGADRLDRGDRPRSSSARGGRRAGGAPPTSVSTIVFHAPHEGHCPAQRGLVAPHCWQTWTDFVAGIWAKRPALRR